MRILFIVPYVPDPIRVRPYHLIRVLANQGHELTVMTLFTSEWERDSLNILKEIPEELIAYPLSLPQKVKNVLGALPGAKPLQAAYCWQPQLARRLNDLILDSSNQERSFDIIHVEHLRGAIYGLSAKNALKQAGHSTPVVWDSVDCITELFRQAAAHSRTFMGRWVTRFELNRTADFEAKMLREFERVLVTSEKDRESLLELVGNDLPTEKISALPNGVDTEHFSEPPNNKRVGHQIVLSGKMSYHANISMVLYFAEEILPRIQNEIPLVEVLVVGKDPPSELIALETNPAITVTGTVPDLRPYLWKAAVAAAPLKYAVGIQNKVLEAMAASVPVVMSDKANGGIGLKDGKHALVRSTPEAFAEAVIRLLKEPTLRQRLSRNGKMFVERNHAWPSIGRDLEGIYHELIKTHH